MIREFLVRADDRARERRVELRDRLDRLHSSERSELLDLPSHRREREVDDVVQGLRGVVGYAHPRRAASHSCPFVLVGVEQPVWNEIGRGIAQTLRVSWAFYLLLLVRLSLPSVDG